VVGVYILSVAKRSKPLAFEQVKYHLKPFATATLTHKNFA